MTSGFYESHRALAEYLLFHYGPDELVLPWPFGPRDALNFPSRCISECLLHDRITASSRALDLGCAVGRGAFELSRHCVEVIAIDLSPTFIAAAERIQRDGELAFDITQEGNLRIPVVARVPAGVHPSRVRFEVGDALRLRRDPGEFDVVLAANLLDRVGFPRELLRVLAGLTRPGGQLILISPYSWLEEHTPRGEWLCCEGEPASTGLAKLLPEFTRKRRSDLPFLIREHARKFQWGVAEATVWIRG